MMFDIFDGTASDTQKGLKRGPSPDVGDSSHPKTRRADDPADGLGTSDSDSSSSSSDEEEEEDEEDRAFFSQDRFSYPKETDNAFIVKNDIMPMTTPDKWLHPFSAIHWSGNVLLRLTILGFEWPGRCFDCKFNNKSSCFCFFGQNTKDGAHDTPLTAELLSRLQRIKTAAAMESSEKLFYEQKRLEGMDDDDADEAFDAVPHDVKMKAPVAPLRIFPDQDVIIDVKSVNRASRQHYIPPIKNLLCQKPFSKYFDETTFFDFLLVRQEMSFGKAPNQRMWCEPLDHVNERAESIKTIRSMPKKHERVTMMMKIITTLYKQWTTGSKCTPLCRRFGCEDCRSIRGRFRKEYKDQVRNVVHDRIASMFEARIGPFKGFSDDEFNGEKFEDSKCRVVQIHNTTR